MNFKKRGQISTEYLIIIAFLTFIILGVLGLALVYTAQVRDSIKFNQIDQFATKVISSAESAYFAGEPSKITLTAYVPQGVTNIIIDDFEDVIIFHVSSQSGVNILSYSSDVPISGSITNTVGVKKIQITASQVHASITEV